MFRCYRVCSASSSLTHAPTRQTRTRGEQPKPKNHVIEPGYAVRIQPNPTGSLLFITGMAEGKNDVEVYDMYGRLLYKKQAGETGSTLNVSNLANGTYTLRIRNEKREYYKTSFALLK